jgi:PAS domain S-box-containing protein
VSSWNCGAERLFGYQDADITGRHCSAFRRVEEADRCANDLETARHEGKCELETWGVREGGSEFWAEVVLRPLHSESGELIGYAMVTRDITERKYLEERLLQKADKLAQADQRKNEFLAMLAHELRTPLSAITNSIYLLENMEIDERAERHLHVIERQNRQLRRLVEDLSDISRIRSGRVELRRQPVELCKVVRSAVEAVLPFLESRGQQLHCSVPEREIYVVEADPQRLEQIVTNLLNNASKYTDPGGSVWLTVAAEGEEAILQVRDSGIGIDAPLLPTIFDLFSQVDPSAARAQGGLGIGLALVKKLVELHQGTVTASSGGLGQGAEFTVRLPLVER